MSASTTKPTVAEQRAMKKAEDEAKAQGSATPPDATTSQDTDEETSVGEPRSHRIHFVNDGFTTMGQVFYRGQELHVIEGSAEWTRIADTKGRTFFDLAEDESEQIVRYGEVKFRPGPWPHESFTAEDVARMQQEANTTADPEEAMRLRKRASRLSDSITPPGS